MGFTTATKNAMLNGSPWDVDLLSLHYGDPGEDGTENEHSDDGYAREAAVFDAADGAERLLDEDVVFASTPLENVTHIGLWEDGTPDVFRGSITRTGDAAVNAAGSYTVKGTTTKLALPDPA